MHILKYSRYPNNEIRLVHYYRANPPIVQLDDDGGILTSASESGASNSESVSSEATSDSLDISSDFAKSPPLSQRKRTKFGIDAKRTILRVGGAYDTVDSTPSNYIFLTGTIPGGTHEAFQAVAEESAYIVRSIADWLRQTAPTELWFYVWELQKRGALHVHYCLHCPHTAIREKILSTWKQKWEDVLQQVSRRSGADMWLRRDGTYHKGGKSVLQAYAQTVNKSVAAYMAGYCASSKNKHSLDATSPYYPSRWWGYSRKSAKLLQGLTETITSEYSDYRAAHREVLLYYESTKHDTDYCHMYPHKVGLGSTIVSYHPEDKGQSSWQRLNPMLFQTLKHPNTCYMIALTRAILSEIRSFLEVSKLPPQSYSLSLCNSLRGLVFPGTQYGYSINRMDIALLLEIPSDLNSVCLVAPLPESQRKRLVIMQRTWRQNQHLLTCDRHGWLCTYKDLPYTVDMNSFLGDTGTNSSTELDAPITGGEGVTADEPPDFVQVELWHQSDSQE